MKTGLGLNGFVWWEGVVEDNTDPHAIGRCRVRCLGWDSASKLDVPTEDLPWAYPVLPLNSPSKTVGLKPGTRVLGFFRDGENAQDRVMLGVINTGTNYVESNYSSAGIGGALGAVAAIAGPLAAAAPIAGQLSEAVPGLSELSDTVSSTVAQVQEQVDAVVGQVTDAVGGVVDQVSGAVEGVASQATEALGGVSEQVQDAASGALDNAKNRLSIDPGSKPVDW
jgi:uncharacterized protein YjbJ (UPF0337 family)